MKKEIRFIEYESYIFCSFRNKRKVLPILLFVIAKALVHVPPVGAFALPFLSNHIGRWYAALCFIGWVVIWRVINYLWFRYLKSHDLFLNSFNEKDASLK